HARSATPGGRDDHTKLPIDAHTPNPYSQASSATPLRIAPAGAFGRGASPRSCAPSIRGDEFKGMAAASDWLGGARVRWTHSPLPHPFKIRQSHKRFQENSNAIDGCPM